MSQQLIDHNNDLKRLRDEGYEIEIYNGYLIVHSIPFVNHLCEIKQGKLILQLAINGSTTCKPHTHVAQFMGEYPCNKDGSPILQIQHATINQLLRDDVIVNFSFSNKPSSGYTCHYHQATTYINIISAPAESIDRNVTARTYKVIPSDNDDSPLQYIDSNASRANIAFLNNKYIGNRIGIIGIGGTGSYILDMVSKTPVKEIHIFDKDEFLQHNAFRAPGAPSIEVLNQKISKVGYYSSIYSNIHKGIIPHCEYIDSYNLGKLSSLSFVFICIDNSEVRKSIIKFLQRNGIDFIDVGLGVNIVDDNLIGMTRVTASTSQKNDHVYKRVPLEDIGNNEYTQNIQICDLNLLNAAFAVIKWKKIIGFYQDLTNEHHSTYSVNVAHLQNEDITV